MNSVVESDFYSLLWQIQAIQDRGYNELAVSTSFQKKLDSILDKWEDAKTSRAKRELVEQLQELALPVFEAEVVWQLNRFVQFNVVNRDCDKVQELLEQGRDKKLPVYERVKCLRAALREIAAVKRNLKQKP
ncbi:hypothetical protein KBG31_00815 [Patescibacteria group bacterium]|nr:hypothetical protein [Patescibacteria group bacterium]